MLKNIFKIVVVLSILLFAGVMAWTHSEGQIDAAPQITKTPAAESVDVQELKKQILALSTELNRVKLQIQDLYFMTEPLRVQVLDKEEGRFYYAKSGKDMYGMLPSQFSYAELYYQLRSANNLGYTKNKIKELSDRLLKMPKNPYLMPHESEYTFSKGELRYHPDLKTYLIVD